MLVVIIARNEEKTIASPITNSKEYGQIMVIDYGSTDNTVELSKKLGAEALKAKDRMDAILLGHRKAKERGLRPLIVLRGLSKDEQIALKSLDADFIDYEDLLDKRNNYERVLRGYDPVNPTTGEKLFYMLWMVTRGIKNTVRKRL